MKQVYAGFLLLMCITTAYASDLAKEKRWAEQVVDALIDGDEVWLKTTDTRPVEFLGIYTEAAETSENTVIVIHGIGIHPDWQQVVQPLRVGLTEHGWNTLSIQMPILPNEAEAIDYAPLFDEVTPRIKAAIKYLKTVGSKNVAIVSHSLGAAMAAYHLSRHHQDVSGLVAIGMSSDDRDQRLNAVFSLSQIALPVLDLYGSNDLEGVLNTATKRKQAAIKSGNDKYTQHRVEGANHFFDNKDDVLITTVEKWLQPLKN